MARDRDGSPEPRPMGATVPDSAADRRVLTAVSPDGTTVSATSLGRGPTVLIVHPGGQDAATWGPVADLLADDVHVVLLNRRIYTRPGVAPPPSHSMADEVADLLAISGLPLGPILLVGHSSGAVVALEAAVSEPGRYVGVVAYEPPMPTTSLVGGPALRAARAHLDRGEPVEAMRVHLTDIVGMPAPMVDAMLADPDARAAFTRFAAAQVADNEAIDGLGVGMDRYRSLAIPVTLVEGAQSPAHLRRRSADLASVLPEVRVVTLDGQGHVAHLSAPDRLAGIIRQEARRRFGA